MSSPKEDREINFSPQGNFLVLNLGGGGEKGIWGYIIWGVRGGGGGGGGGGVWGGVVRGGGGGGGWISKFDSVGPSQGILPIVSTIL